MRILLVNIFSIFMLCSHSVISADKSDQEDKQKLLRILAHKSFNEGLVEDLAREVRYKGRIFRVDDQGRFYLKDTDGKKYFLDIYYDKNSPKNKSIFIIKDPHHPAAGLPYNPYSTHLATIKQGIAFDDLVSLQRLIGIYTMKTENPECYIAYAAQRLGADNLYKRLLALERKKDPRPLAFKSDAEWRDFKSELKDIFKPFSSPDAHIVIVGSSTSFFSENPRKGRNRKLLRKIS